MISDDSMKEMIRSLNSQRRKIFDEVYIWCKSTCKYQSLLTKKKVNPLIVFTSGGVGVGKSYLINTIFHMLTRTFNLYCDTSEKVKVLNKTSTGVAPVNINGTTIHFVLGIPTTKGNDIPISAISDSLQALCEILDVSLDIFFAGLTFILLGDLDQLPTV